MTNKTAAIGLLLPVIMIAQESQPNPTPPSIADKVAKLVSPAKGAWTDDQLLAMSRLRDAAIGDDYAWRQLAHLTDVIGPRLSGSQQAQAAVEYVAEEMRALGAEVQLEKVMVPHWVRGVETGELVSWAAQSPGARQKIVLTALGGSPATGSEGLTSEVAVADSFADLKRLGPDAAKGKILLLNARFDKQLAAQGNGGDAYDQAVAYRVAAPMIAASVGARAVLVRSVGGADYRLPHTGYTDYSSGGTAVPAAAITAEDADLIVRLAHSRPVAMHLTLTPQTLPQAESCNVIADWKGSEHPEQIVIVSGHLDSWDLGTGAIDDGAGVVVSMQALHLLQQLGIHPRRTVRFVAWMDEESGASGAQQYAREHGAQAADHIAAIESDLGAGHPGGILYAGKPTLAAWLAPVSRVLQSIGAATLTAVPEAGTDVGFVNQLGPPGFSPAQDSRFYFNYHHTAADTLDKVNPRELAENAAVMTVLAYALADASENAPR